jgi:endonuclease YncB( thermonuclease family)
MIRALLVAILGVVSFAIVYVAMPRSGGDVPPPALPLSEPAAAPSHEPAVKADPLAGTMSFELRTEPTFDEPTGTVETRVVRDVTPENVTAGPEVTGPLTRVAVPEEAPAPHIREARMQRLYNAIVLSAGVLKVRDREIRLAGIEAPDFDLRCGEGAEAWPCGRMARAALRSLIRGRAIECEVPPGAHEIPDSARCQVAGEDMSEWLVANGWARHAAEPLAQAENAAREAKLGLWSERRPGAQPGAVSSSG